jgi:integrase
MGFRLYRRKGKKTDSWVLDTRRGEIKGNRIVIGHTDTMTKAEAESIRIEKELEYYLNKSGVERIIEITTKELFDNFIQFKQMRIAPSTWDTYEHRIAFWGKKHGERFMPLKLITIEKIVVEEMKHLANGTINSYLNLLIQIYDYAIAHKYCKENPAQSIPKLKRKSKPKSRYLTKEEFERLLEYSSGFFKSVWIMLAYTGMRKDEVRLLKWEDIDIINKVIKIGFREDFNTKTGIKKIIPIHPKVEKVLRGLKRISVYVFASPHTKKPYHTNTWLKNIKRYAEKAGLKDVNIHTLRHTFATWLALEGISKDIRMALLGHTDEKTTDIYTHYPIEYIQDAINKLI